MGHLNTDDQELMESVEGDSWHSVPNLAEEIEQARQYARATLIKDQRMNIRITRKDLESLKVRSLEEGIPYQTLVSSIIHKYLTGRLVERE